MGRAHKALQVQALHQPSSRYYCTCTQNLGPRTPLSTLVSLILDFARASLFPEPERLLLHLLTWIIFVLTSWYAWRVLIPEILPWLSQARRIKGNQTCPVQYKECHPGNTTNSQFLTYAGHRPNSLIDLSSFKVNLSKKLTKDNHIKITQTTIYYDSRYTYITPNLIICNGSFNYKVLKCIWGTIYFTSIKKC